MGLSKFLAHANPLTRMRQAKALQKVHSVERFRVILERERARADRNGHQFSVVAFDIDNPKANSTNANQFASVLLKRIRFTDDLGWFDNHRIAALLPETTSVGARSMAENVCQILSATTSPPKYTIHTYPSKKPTNGDKYSEQLYHTERFPERRTITSHSGPKSSKQDINGGSPSATDQANSGSVQQREEMDRIIEKLFYKPLPFWKRAMDIIISLFGLVVLSPIMLLIAIIIKIESIGPVFYKQQRVGYSGKFFTMWKFRTMKSMSVSSIHKEHMSSLINGANGRGSDRPMIKLDNDLHLGIFSKILRKTSADELPQLINVFRGEMSLVGPRPPIPYEVKDYLQWHYGRLDAVPGMTGLWQVSGKNQLTFPEMVQLDIRYSRKISLWSDIMILLKTPLAIFSDIKAKLS